MTMNFDDQVVLVTGSGRGLGKAFALYLAEQGATVVVNDSGSGSGQAVTDQIQSADRRAYYVPGAVEDSAQLIESIVDLTGRLDAVIHNAGFVRDKTVRKMSSEQWDQVLSVHLKAAFGLSQAAWPHFEEQGGGRLVFISSASGLYGNFGQANYAAAKAGMHGLAQTIELEGAQANICCNCVAPFGATEMNSANMPEELKAVIKPEYIAPLVAYLSHPDCQESGSLFEASAGVYKKVRWERAAGLQLDPSNGISLDDIADNWEQVTSFDQTEHPTEMREALQGMWQLQVPK